MERNRHLAAADLQIGQNRRALNPARERSNLLLDSCEPEDGFKSAAKHGRESHARREDDHVTMRHEIPQEVPEQTAALIEAFLSGMDRLTGLIER